MKIEGNLDFNLYLEEGMLTMDPDFQKGEFENLDSFFICNRCGAEYQGALDILQESSMFFI